MNKKQARRIALELVVCCIDMEIFNPSELPYSLLYEYGFDVEDYAKLRDQLEEISAELHAKMTKLNGALNHTRNTGDWMFMTKEQPQ